MHKSARVLKSQSQVNTHGVLGRDPNKSRMEIQLMQQDIFRWVHMFVDDLLPKALKIENDLHHVEKARWLMYGCILKAVYLVTVVSFIFFPYYTSFSGGHVANF